MTELWGARDLWAMCTVCRLGQERDRRGSWQLVVGGGYGGQ